MGSKPMLTPAVAFFHLVTVPESVVAALLAPLESANVAIKCRQRVDAIRYGDGHFSLHCHDFSADYDIVLIASGGAKCISVTAAKPNA